MEHRFGIKDFFITLIVFVLIVLVLLAMRQFDRQYEQVLSIKTQNEQLANDVARIKRTVSDLSANGVTVAPSNGSATPTTASSAGIASKVDAFTRIEQAEKLPNFARGGWFLDNFGTKVGKLTPLLSTDVYASWVQNLVQETLAIRDPYTLEYVPRVARRWDISPDGLTMTFYMNENVTFSDGHPCTAEDVVFTFDWIRNPEVNAPRDRAYLTTMDTVKALDTYTVQFKFKEPYFKNFEAAAATNILAKHFYSKYTPNQFNEKVGLLIGSGPYMLENQEAWTPGNGVKLIRNPRYWALPPTFDRINFNEIQEEAANMVMYGNQEFDLVRCTPEMYDKLVRDPRIMGFSNNFRYPTPYGGYSYIGWNQRRKVGGEQKPTAFADKRVRQAMTMLLDRERMAKQIFLGYATVASGPFAPGGPQSDPNIKPWPHDEERAKKLLKEAGFEDRNGDGVIEDANGTPLKFKLTYPGGQDIYEKIVLFLRDNLARGGVVLEPERLDWPVLVNRLNESDFDAIILGWSSVPESDAYQVFHSSQIADQGDNRTAYKNPDCDRAIENARKTVDTAKRMQYWQEVHRILHEDQPYTFLLNRDSLKLINKRVQNVETSKAGLNFEPLNGGMIPWFIPKDQQRTQ